MERRAEKTRCKGETRVIDSWKGRGNGKVGRGRDANSRGSRHLASSSLCFQVDGSWWRVLRWKHNRSAMRPSPLPLERRTWFDLAHSDWNFFLRTGPSSRASGDNSPRVISVWLRNQEGKSPVALGRSESNIRGGRGTRGSADEKIRDRGKKRRPSSNVSPTLVLRVLDWSSCLFLCLIKLNLNLISTELASTNGLEKICSVDKAKERGRETEREKESGVPSEGEHDFCCSMMHDLWLAE